MALLQVATDFINKLFRQLRRDLPLILGCAYFLFGFTLLQRSDRPEISTTTGVFLLALLYHWWETRKPFREINFNISAIAIAILVSWWLFFKAINYDEDEAFLRVLPLFSLTSWSLFCYGWQSFRKFSAGFFLLGFLAFPWEIIYIAIDLSLLTAKLTHLILIATGFHAERIGTLIRLASGSIEVYHGCSGLKMVLQLVGFSLIYLVLNSQSRLKIVSLMGGAIAIGFTLNGLRVAMMAVLVSLGDEKAFDYWHLGTGSLIFSVIGLAALVLWGWQIQRWQNL